jgi:cytochrome c biogenesis factor
MLMPGVEVFCPKTIIIKQYLSTKNFSINNTHFVIKSSQTTQLYITKVIYKHFICPVWEGHKDVTELLLGAGASLSTVDKQVIKP